MRKKEKIFIKLVLVVVSLGLIAFGFWFGPKLLQQVTGPIWLNWLKYVAQNFDFLGSARTSDFAKSKNLASDLEKYLNQLNRPLKSIQVGGRGPEVLLVAVGDLMFDRGVAQVARRRGGGDFSYLFKNIPDLKGEADILLGNLEGPISDQGADLGNLYSFRFSPTVLTALKVAGFDILNVANNHAGDWGRIAFEDSLRRLAADGFSYVGGGFNQEEAESPVIIKKNGLAVGFLGFSDIGPSWLAATENEAGILNIRDSTFESIIARAAAQVDVLVVTIHFGEEYQKTHNERQKELATMAFSAGAQAVIGHHPHVVQDDELASGKYVAYSLGNFIFDQNFSAETMEGLVLKLRLRQDGVVGVEKLPVKLNQFFQPSFNY